MKFWTRKIGSQRTSAEAHVTEFVENFAGQGGTDYICFTADGKYHYIQPETEEDCKVLLRQAHVAYSNFKGGKR